MWDYGEISSICESFFRISLLLFYKRIYPLSWLSIALNPSFETRDKTEETAWKGPRTTYTRTVHFVFSPFTLLFFFVFPRWVRKTGVYVKYFQQQFCYSSPFPVGLSVTRITFYANLQDCLKYACFTVRGEDQREADVAGTFSQSPSFPTYYSSFYNVLFRKSEIFP